MRRLLCLLLALWTAVSLSPAFGASKLLMFGSGGIKPLVSYDLTASNTLPAGISYSATSLRTELDSNGFITYAPNEQFLNNASPATQNVTTKASNYVLWCNSASTGTITLTGTSTAGPLTCTTAGANLAFAPTAGTLTLTVGGTSVTRVVLAQVTYETTLRPQDNVTVTSSAYYGPAFDSNYPSAGYQGLRIEEQRTNVSTNTGVLTTNWSAVGTVRTTDGTLAPDDSTPASLITASAGSGEHSYFQSVASATTSASTYSISIDVKAGTWNYVYLNLASLSSINFNASAVFDLSNTNNKQASQTHAGSSGTFVSSAQSYNSGWYRITIVGSAAKTDMILSFGQAAAATGNTFSADGNVSFTAGGTEKNYFAFAQEELGSNSTSYIPNSATSGAVTRSADIAQATGTLAACFNSNNMTTIGEIVFNDPLNNAVITTPTRYLYVHADAGEVPSTYNGLTVLEAKNGAVPFNTPVRLGMTQRPSGRAVAANGGGLNSDNAVTSSSGTVTIGAIGGAQWIDGYVRKIACWSPALPNNLLQQKSTVGPGPITWNLSPSQNFLHASDTGSQILNSGDGLTPIMVN